MAHQTRVWCYFIPKVRDCHLDTLTLAPGPEGRRVGAMRVSAWAGGAFQGGALCFTRAPQALCVCILPYCSPITEELDWSPQRCSDQPRAQRLV